uniref:Uncharacterized protein n=1 Tax=Fagus sylvatica TaxID=28930 RepID=A0A2N9H3B0_FAGSY
MSPPTARRTTSSTDLQTSSPRTEPSSVSLLRRHSQGQSCHRRRRKPRRGGRGSVGHSDRPRVLGRAGKPKTPTTTPRSANPSPRDMENRGGRGEQRRKMKRRERKKNLLK